MGVANRMNAAPYTIPRRELAAFLVVVVSADGCQERPKDLLLVVAQQVRFLLLLF